MIEEGIRLRLTVDTSELRAGVAEAQQTVNRLNSSSMSNAAQQTNEEMTQLRNTMESIRGMGFAAIIVENFGTIKEAIKDTSRWLAMSREEMGMVFDIRHFEGANNIRELLQSMRLQFRESVASMRSGTDTLFEGLGQAMGGISATMAMVVASLAVVLGQIVAIVATTKMAINNAKEIAQLSHDAAKIGMDTHAYEEWGYILEQNGIEVDKLSDFLKTLAAEQNSVREGAEDTIAAFERLGISAEEAATMSQSELFDKTVSGLSKIENQVERTGLAYKIFGEDDAANLIPILSLSNQELEQLRRNYELLGGAASQTLVERSQALKSSLGNLSEAWQGVKNAITEAVLPAIISVVNWLTKAIAVVGMFLKAIFGTDTKKAEDSTKSMSSGMGGYTSSVNDATAAVQKLKREQMGFDELNVLPGKDSSGGGSGSSVSTSGGGGGLGTMDIPTVEDMGLEGIQEWINKYKTKIQTIATISLIGIGALLAVIGLLHGNIPLALIGIGLAGLGIAIGNLDGGLFDRAGKAIFDWWDGKVKPWFKEKVAPVFTKKYWEEKWNVIKAVAVVMLANKLKTLKDGFKPIKDWFNEKVKPVFTKKYWEEKFDTIKAGAKTKLDEAKATIKEKFKPIKEWFDEKVAPKFTKKYWQDKFNTIKQGAADKLAEAKTAISDKWKSVKDWFNANVKPKFTKDYWLNKFNTVKDGAKSAFNGVISVVESAINNIIKKINTLSWKIPDWVPKVGGERFGFNFSTVSIPRLATGGIATRSVLANIGEAGREAVLPLDRNTGWMDQLADKIAARSGGPSKLFLQVDGKTLGWVAIDNINKITKQTGEIPLAI